MSALYFKLYVTWELRIREWTQLTNIMIITSYYYYC
jgi:hypothetical protein